jgi:hypothetical protein
MMGAKIVAQNHEVCTFLLNGRTVHIVDKLDRHENQYYRIISQTIEEIGSRDWADVNNALDKWIQTLGISEQKSVSHWMTKLTY